MCFAYLRASYVIVYVLFFGTFLGIFFVCSRSFDEKWMLYAIELADCAKYFDEVAVGAVLVLNGKVIGTGWNSSIAFHDPTAHAEIIALRQGGQSIGNYRLLNTTLYVTVEPCMMCFFAMIHARIFRLVFGAKNIKHGFLQGNFLNGLILNHRIVYTSGVLEKLCVSRIVNFFRQKRKNCFFNISK